MSAAKMTEKEREAQDEIIRFFLSKSKEGGECDGIDACLARALATDLSTDFGNFMDAERSRPNQHPGDTIGGIASLLGMLMAYAMDMTTAPKEPEADVEGLVDGVMGVVKATCLQYLAASQRLEKKNG